MDYREKAFRDKFKDASAHLGVKPEQIVSLKIRENVGGYSDYDKLIDDLQHLAGLKCNSCHGSYQGNGYLITSSKTKLIVVKHETGLEILYIAGSVASLIGLIPLVIRCWRVIRGRFHSQHHHNFSPPHPNFHDVEIRHLDNKGNLIEERTNSMAFSMSEPTEGVNTVFLSAAESIEEEMKRLKGRLDVMFDIVEYLTKRVNKLETRRFKKTAQKINRKPNAIAIRKAKG